MGRPKKDFNEKLFDTLIQLPLIKDDIAKALGVSDFYIDAYCKKRFKQTFLAVQEQNRQTFRKNILGKQYELAMKGNTALLIWLGKQYLGQTDKVETKNETNLTLEPVFTTQWGGTFEPTDVTDTASVGQLTEPET